jgi:hypothetical protein
MSWTNTTSSEFMSTANDTFPWYAGHKDWAYNYDSVRYYGLSYAAYRRPDVYDPLHRNMTADTPISRSASQITSERGNYNWPLWMFVVVAVMLTFGSIIVPLVAPRAYRSVARFSLRKRRTFRTIVSVLWTVSV